MFETSSGTSYSMLAAWLRRRPAIKSACSQKKILNLLSEPSILAVLPIHFIMEFRRLGEAMKEQGLRYWKHWNRHATLSNCCLQWRSWPSYQAPTQNHNWVYYQCRVNQFPNRQPWVKSEANGFSIACKVLNHPCLWQYFCPLEYPSKPTGNQRVSAGPRKNAF